MNVNEVLDIFKDDQSEIYQARSKETALTIAFDDAENQQIFEKSLSLLSEKNGTLSFEKLVDQLSRTYPREKVISIVQDLRDNGIITDYSLRSVFKSRLEPQLKFWARDAFAQQGKHPEVIQEEWSSIQLGIIGDAYLVDLLEEKKSRSGIKKSNKFYRPAAALSNEELDKLVQNDFVIVAYDQLHPYQMDQINLAMLAANKPWLLVRGLTGLTASIGPIFAGKATGCLTCLDNRLKSNMEHPSLYESYQAHLKQTRGVAQSEGAPMAAYDIVASMAMMEVMKFHMNWAVPVTYGNYITFDLYSLETSIHPFLKAPVCPVCKPQLEHSPAPWLEPLMVN